MEKFRTVLSFIEDKDNWFASTCSCSLNQKNYICKHIALQAVRSKFVEIPLQAKTIPLHDMPKRGRPSIISKALEVDNQLPSILKKTSIKRKYDSQQLTTSKRAKK